MGMRVRAELRARWRSLLALVLLVGLAGGVVLTAVTGARRGATTLDRFLEYTGDRLYEMEVDDSVAEQIAAMPYVTGSGRGAFMYASPVTDEGVGAPTVGEPGHVYPIAFFDQQGAGISRFLMVDGEEKAAADMAVDEMYVDESLATRYGLTVGSRFGLKGVAPEQMEEEFSTTMTARGPLAWFRVLGIVRLPQDLDPNILDESQDAVQARADWAAGLGGALITGQAMARQTRLAAADHDILRAIGVRSSQLRAEGLVRGAALGGLGAALAVAVAIALSPLTPVGLARRAEVDPGVWIDLPVLALGAAALVLLLVGVSGLTALPSTRGAGSPEGGRVSRLAVRFTEVGGSVPAVSGVRMALEPGGGRTAVPVRAAIIGAAVAVAAVTASATFSTSLDRLLGDRAAQGWSYDATAGDDEDGLPPRAAESVRAMATVEAAGALAAGSVGIPGLEKSVRLAGLDPVKGDLAPTIVQGRSVLAADEIVLGTSTMRALGVAVGDTVHLFDSDKDVEPANRLEADFVVVGRGVLPAALAEETVAFDWSLGDGGIVTVDGLRRVNPDVRISSFALRFAPSADPEGAEREVEAVLGNTMISYYPPFEIENLRRVRSLPTLLAAVLAVLASGTIAHALITGVARRRRDLALLVALGFRRREVRATVFWQATALVSLALVIGIPIGVTIGRWSWIAVVTRLGGVLAPRVPIVALLLSVPAVIAVANAVAAGPGWRAARTRPAVSLRTE